MVSLLVIMSVLSGCSKTAPTAKPTVPPKAAIKSLRNYRLIGVVRQVDPKTGIVTIRHEDVPGFMKAMTMPFAIKNRESLEDVREGDEVEGTLKVEYDGKEVKDYELIDLVVSKPALAPAVSLSFGPNGPELKPAIKRLEPGDLVPDFTMTTQDGKTLKLSDLRGKIVGLTFIFTRCPLPDFCPRMDRKFAEAAGRIGTETKRASRIRLISVSFDPEHDTPDVLAKHAAIQGAKPPLWTFAVATHPELGKVAPSLGLMYGPQANEIIHNLVIAVIDADGKLIRVETGNAAKTWDIADFLKTLYSRIPG